MGTSHKLSVQWATIVLGLLILAIHQTAELFSRRHLVARLHHLQHPDQIAYTYEGTDRPNELPVFVPEAAMKVDAQVESLYGLHDDTAWASLFPRSKGFVALGPEDTLFGIAMTHQIHCLNAVRYGYVAAKYGKLSWPGNGTKIDEHVTHCVTYLMQDVLCRADTTLEETYTLISEDGKKETMTDGTNVTHRCKDWTAVREFMEANFDQRREKGIVDEEGGTIFPSTN